MLQSGLDAGKNAVATGPYCHRKSLDIHVFRQLLHTADYAEIRSLGRGRLKTTYSSIRDWSGEWPVDWFEAALSNLDPYHRRKDMIQLTASRNNPEFENAGLMREPSWDKSSRREILYYEPESEALAR